MTRKTSLIALALAAGFAGSAFAESPIVVNDNFASSRTRAEVQADFAAFKKSGVNPASSWYNPLRAFRSTTTRDAVVADYIASRDEVRALTGEDSGSQYLAQRQAPVGPSLLAGTAQ